MNRFSVCLLFAVVMFFSEMAVAQDGEKLARRCIACHDITGNKHKIGPYLKGVYGRKVGKLTDFNYSKAMSQTDFVWNDENLDRFLAKPRDFVPGTKMAFPGFGKPEERKAIIEFLKNNND